LILFGLGSLLANLGSRETGILERSLSGEIPPEQAAPRDENRAPLQGAAFSQQPAPRSTRPTRAVENLDLDLASPATIRQTLNRAIEQARQHRPLFISPGIVDAAASDERVRVIFETGPGWIEESVIAMLAGDSGSAGFDSLRVFPRFDRGAAAVGPQALLHLIENPGTGHIEHDTIHRASLVQTIPIIRADIAHQQGQDGDDFAIAILDTGVDPTHPMYADRIIEEACFSVQKDCPNGQSEMFGAGASVPCAIAGCGHGTRVAGIALGYESTGRLVGVAPHAGLIAIQIFSNVEGEPGAYASDILAGLQHVLGLADFYEIASANLSLGGNPFTSEADCDQTVASHFSAITSLRKAGILTVAASGNESLTNAITTPACLSNVIGVGSTSDNDEVSSFSNSASFLRILAPGEFVESSKMGGGSAEASGTSIAAPHVSGAIATIREAVPAATADEIDNALALSGVAIVDSRNGITLPRIRVAEAITLLETAGSTSGDPSEPAADTGAGDSSPVATTQSGGGGKGCGLVGLESFLVLGLVRCARRRRHSTGHDPT